MLYRDKIIEGPIENVAGIVRVVNKDLKYGVIETSKDLDVLFRQRTSCFNVEFADEMDFATMFVGQKVRATIYRTEFGVFAVKLRPSTERQASKALAKPRRKAKPESVGTLL